MISLKYAAALVAILMSHHALADDGLPPPCDLVDTADLAEMGFRIFRSPAHEAVDLEKGEADAPTATHTEICTFLAGPRGDRLGLQLTVDTFAEKVTEAQLRAWTQLIMKDDKATFRASRIGNASCETGEFALVDARTRSQRGIQHFVSCDTLEPGGFRRVNLYFQAPEDKALLPPPEQVKTLLDKITLKARLKGAITL
jgi:hypothetical protein